MKHLISLALVLSLSACGGNSLFRRDAASAPVADAESGVTSDGQIRPRARPDGSQPAGDAAMASAGSDTPNPGQSGSIGRTVASLGAAAEGGMWLKTPLVTSRQPGRVVLVSSGASANVDLIPIEGPATAGSRMSLQAMQALGAPLTGLPEIDVFTQ